MNTEIMNFDEMAAVEGGLSDDWWGFIYVCSGQAMLITTVVLTGGLAAPVALGVACMTTAGFGMME